MSIRPKVVIEKELPNLWPQALHDAAAEDELLDSGAIGNSAVGRLKL